MSNPGILLMAHGTPGSLDEMPEYLQLVRGGRPPSAELVAEMRHNYAAIGGRSPLTDITMAQAEALRARLGPDVPVAVGMRNWRPFIADALADLVQRGADQIIGIPLAPQFSTLSVQKYVDAALKALPPSARFVAVRSFATHPLLLEAFAERVCAARPASDEEVIFTAHSLPARVIEAGDSYAQEVASTARGVAERSSVRTYEIAYQSAGRTPEPWIGPDLSELVRTRAASGVQRFLAVPIGFVCDHTEILFDIDVQASTAARECGATLRRTESLNTSATFVALLEALVRGKFSNP
jgi:ferrochelatase